jgi:hypothetical protein
MNNSNTSNNTIKLYHGTNSQDINNLLDYPAATKNINGIGFYVSLEFNSAKKYGSEVVCWEVDAAFLAANDVCIMPIDQRYVEDMALWDECLAGGTECRLPQRTADLMAVYCEDAYMTDAVGTVYR